VGGRLADRPHHHATSTQGAFGRPFSLRKDSRERFPATPPCRPRSSRPTGTGQWVRGLNGNVIWDPYDMDAPPDHDPMPVILGQLALMAERRREQGDYREPTEEQKADVRRQLEEMIERHRAERQLCGTSATPTRPRGVPGNDTASGTGKALYQGSTGSAAPSFGWKAG
jgi:hypothetical protein